jgi:hypothetical protein
MFLNIFPEIMNIHEYSSAQRQSTAALVHENIQKPHKQCRKNMHMIHSRQKQPRVAAINETKNQQTFPVMGSPPRTTNTSPE